MADQLPTLSQEGPSLSAGLIGKTRAGLLYGWSGATPVARALFFGSAPAPVVATPAALTITLAAVATSGELRAAAAARALSVALPAASGTLSASPVAAALAVGAQPPTVLLVAELKTGKFPFDLALDVTPPASQLTAAPAARALAIATQSPSSAVVVLAGSQALLVDVLPTGGGGSANPGALALDLTAPPALALIVATPAALALVVAPQPAGAELVAALAARALVLAVQPLPGGGSGASLLVLQLNLHPVRGLHQPRAVHSASLGVLRLESAPAWCRVVQQAELPVLLEETSAEPIARREAGVLSVTAEERL